MMTYLSLSAEPNILLYHHPQSSSSVFLPSRSGLFTVLAPNYRILNRPAIASGLGGAIAGSRSH